MRKGPGRREDVEQQLDSYETVTEPAEIRALEPHWDALHERSSDRRFSRSFAWCWATWEKVEEPRGHRLWVLVAREGSRTTLIWPFVISHDLFWSLARPLGAAYGEYAGPVIEDASAATRLATAWGEVRATCGADVITMPWVRAGSDLHSLLESRHDTRATGSVPTLAVEWSRAQDWDGYMRTRAADLRRHVRKGRRELMQLGRLELEVAEGGPRCVEVVDWILPRKVEQLMRTGRRGPWLQTAAYRNLLCAVATCTSPSGNLATFALKLDGRILAATMARRDSLRVEMLNTVFDPAYARYRVGHLLTAEALHWAYERGLDFDMRIGDYPYKRLWCNAACDTLTYVCINSRLGRTHAHYRAGVERLKRARRRSRERAGRVLRALGRR